ncbi:MAG TPA: hypothetical protein VGG71_08570 [Chitinophagaceae bacterium]
MDIESLRKAKEQLMGAETKPLNLSKFAGGIRTDSGWYFVADGTIYGLIDDNLYNLTPEGVEKARKEINKILENNG